MILEIATHSLFSALAAQKGGADRIELCMALELGGLSPSPGLLQIVREQVHIPIHVLVRPRAGGFVYSNSEVDTMAHTIQYCKQLGADGVVVGCLTEDRLIAEDQISLLKQEAGHLDFTFHRAFDFLKNPKRALEVLSKLGVNRVLTSGQAKVAWEGRDLIKTLIQQKTEVIIMPGAGINSNNIVDLATYTGATEFHGSAKMTKNTAAVKEQTELNQFGTWTQMETNVDEVVRLKKLLLDV